MVKQPALDSAATTLPAALELASKGFPVFPVWGVTPRGNCTCGRENCNHLAGGKPGKRPAVAKWPQVATTDPEVIRKWWKRHPNANIGIHANQLLVIDVDGPDGHRSL
ncbi:bifunctional DNA primase/polymerase, partial [Symmachiella dynata]|uniref:bifunctional DNA primase/polymerase n=1 Tax=Symmachiella dynata TaxID=2527995 RepID=UPI003C6FBF91